MPLREHEFREIRINENQTLLKGVNEILSPFSTFEFELDKIHKYLLSNYDFRAISAQRKPYFNSGRQ